MDGGWRPLLQHLAGVHHHQAVGQHGGFVQVVRDEHDRDRHVAPQVGQQPVQALAVHLVDGGEGFVQQQHARLAGQRARHRHALLLAARQPRRSAVLLRFGQAHLVQPAPGLALSLGGRQVQQRQPHVVQRREMRHQRIVLEHQPDMALLRRHEDTGRGVAPDLVAHLNAAAMRAHKSGQHAQHGGLAGARGAHQRQQFAGLALKRAAQGQGMRLLDLEVHRHRRAASRAEAKNDIVTAPSDSTSSSQAMRSAAARSKACTRS